MTQINYPDLTRRSPSGELQLEIRSPDNDPDSPREDSENRSRQFWGGFQRDFAFTVRRTDTSGIVWQRGADHESPIDMPNDAWVGNDGHVVVITRTPFSSDLFVLDTTGEISLHCDVGSVILENNKDELHWTSAGPHWNSRGHGMFFCDKSTRWWCFRTELGRQVIVNLDEARLGTLSEVATRLHELQSEWALATTRRASEDERLFGQDATFWDGTDDDEALFHERYQHHAEIWAAIQWCGVDGVVEAISFLEKLEQSTIYGGYSCGWPTPDIKESYVTQLTLVPISQMAMRCLNHQPAGLAGYWLCDESGPSYRSRLDVPDRIIDRTDRLQTLKVGMSKHDVVQSVGMPDVDWRFWDYDILRNNDPHTVRMKWSNEDRLDEIENCPPAWRDLYSRVAWI